MDQEPDYSYTVPTGHTEADGARAYQAGLRYRLNMPIVWRRGYVKAKRAAERQSVTHRETTNG